MTIKDLKSEEEDPNKPSQPPSEGGTDPVEELHFNRLEDLTPIIGDTKPSTKLPGDWIPLGEEPTTATPVIDDLTPVRVIDNLPPSLENTPPPPPGASDPLPNRVDQIDLGATQVTSTALPITKPRKTSKSRNGNDQPPRNGKTETDGRNLKGCLVKAVIIFLFAFVLIVIIAGAFLVYQYFTIAATLPSVEDMTRASQFETTRFYDRNGDLLYEMIDPNAGRRTYIPLEEISPYVIAATISVEDKEFYNHPGFDPVALARALVHELPQR